MSALYLVRHGQASFGSGDYDRLTTTGLEQCRVLARHWLSLGRPVPQVFSGPLRRQRMSAEAFCAVLAEHRAAGPVPEIVGGLEEYDHHALLVEFAGGAGGAGERETDRRRFHRQLESALHAWVDHALEGPEPFAQFRERCVAALEAVMHRVGRGGTGVVFGSAGSLAAAMQPILGLGDWDLLRLKLNFYNTGVSKLLFNDESRVVESINSIAHLEQPETLDLITHR